MEGFYSSAERMLIPRGGNLTLRGAFLHTPVPDPQGTRGILRLQFPGHVTMMKIPVLVVWSNADERQGPRGMGLRFEGALNWQLKRIAAVLIEEAGWQSFGNLVALSGERSRECRVSVSAG
jgi:hypothetical protein